MKIVTDAFLFALKRHYGQYRKDGSTPYIIHPFRVFLWLADKVKTCEESVLAAAFLHDLIEDTKTDYAELNEKFETDVVKRPISISNTYVVNTKSCAPCAKSSERIQKKLEEESLLG